MEKWRDLFQAAQGFYQLAPWEWMWDSDVFGVQDPESKEVGYLCVLGNLGEVFGLVVYVGSKGFDGHVRMLARDPDTMDLDLIAGQRCLTAFFEDREELTARDRALIRELELKFRGPNAWPVFRSHRPGYEAWYLTSDEARFLTLALVQAQGVAKRLVDDLDLLNRAPDDLYLVRVPLDKEGKRWKDKWQPPPPPPLPPTIEPVPEKVCSKLRRQERPRRGVWEVDVFTLPVTIKGPEGSPPYYAAALLCVHQESYFVVGTEVVPYWDRLSQLPRRFAGVLEKSPIDWPKDVWVKRTELVAPLSPLLAQLGIGIHLSRRLPSLEDAQESLISWLKEGGRSI
jgi:hypothetical protein